jgi:hypothetical protein
VKQRREGRTGVGDESDRARLKLGRHSVAARA